MKKIMYLFNSYIKTIKENILHLKQIKDLKTYTYYRFHQFLKLFTNSIKFYLVKKRNSQIKSVIRKKIIERKICYDVPHKKNLKSKSIVGLFSAKKKLYDLFLLNQIIKDHLGITPDLINSSENIENYQVIIYFGENLNEVDFLIGKINTLLFFPTKFINIDKSLCAKLNDEDQEIFKFRMLSSGYSHPKKNFDSKFGKFQFSGKPLFFYDIFENTKVFYLGFDLLGEILTSLLWHQYNLVGSIPEIISNGIRLLQIIFEKINLFSLYTNKCKIRTLISIDSESELNFLDTRNGHSTNLNSKNEKDCMKLSKTLSSIEDRASFPILLFLVFSQIMKNEQDMLYKSNNTYKENLEKIKNLDSNFLIGYHYVHHEIYRDNIFNNCMSKQFIRNEFEIVEKISIMNNIRIFPIQRYPSLFRNSFQINELENANIKFDSSDAIFDYSKCISPSIYRLWKYNFRKNLLTQTNIWEIPCIWADPYIPEVNRIESKHFLKKIKEWSKFKDSSIALLFHDKFCGCKSTKTECLHNTYDIRKKFTPALNKDVIWFWNRIYELVDYNYFIELIRA